VSLAGLVDEGEKESRKLKITAYQEQVKDSEESNCPEGTQHLAKKFMV